VLPIDPRTIKPGTTLTRGLYSSQGVKLLAAGTTLTEAMVHTLRTTRRGELFYANSLGGLQREKVVESAPPPQVGAKAEADLVTAGGVLAVEAGQPVEEHHADALSLGAYRGKTPRETAKQRALRVKLAEEYVAERALSWSRLPLGVARGAEAIDPLDLSRVNDRGWPDERMLAEFRGVRVKAFRGVLARIIAGVTVHASEPMELVDELIEKLERHPARFTQLALLMPRPADYLPDHCYTTAALSVAIAARLGWGRADVRLAGLAGLLADVGMGLVPREVRVSARPLTEVDVNRVFRHPTFSVMLLDSMEGLPETVRRAAYQHHERENGAGYPNALKSAKISELAKVVAVADAFAAATGPRLYRPRRKPYDVLEDLIMVGSQKMYERRCVRALVESTGLFPVGSFVRLSTGEMAVVIGAHAQQIDRPIVRIVERGVHPATARARGMGPMVDLIDYEPWELHVLTAVDDPTSETVAA